jgi:ribosome-binding protein aMBF1 (putative translation factor)
MNGDPGEDGLPILPGFREMAQRRAARPQQAERQEAERQEAERHERVAELVAELVARRRAARLSQGEVAERMGTSQPAVARLEAGLVDARVSTVQRYAAAVGAQLTLGTRLTTDGEDRGRHA